MAFLKIKNLHQKSKCPTFISKPFQISCCSVTKLCPMNCNMPGFPVLHYLPEFAQTHVH